ncbi:MAG: SPFH domain-containing protein [Gammaproteobacteria bacterium]|nr:SPFH domain-containing protein [Gammaproteobacteria bacterium]
MDLANILTISGVILVALIIIGLIFARLYKRASKEVSFVRTGFGGQKVIMNGGALVFPVLHETIPVNMNTLRLEVRRANEQALITRDRMRVDVTGEFYVRVKPEQESIAFAAQTLGMKTMNPAALKELVEGKFVDSLRAVAAEMAMMELHEKRVDFVQKVQQVVSEDLLKNGLELETVSLTGLDQTSKEHFNPDNTFDAEGLTLLTREIEQRRKIRNDIEQETNVQIANKNLEAERQKLEIQREDEYARLAQEREVEIRRASQSAEIARERAEKNKEAQEAEIIAKKEVDMAQILAERAIEESRIDKERQIREKDIQREKAIETADIERGKAIEISEQDKAIAVAEKSKEKSQAQAEADIARQGAVKESEKVQTVKETAIAERKKEIEIIQAREDAEKQAIQLTVAAEAEKQAAEDQADAVKTLANAEADKHRIEAQGDADAIKLRAEADAKRFAVEAEGQTAINEARNILNNEQIALEVRLKLLNELADIVRESVKPMEQIDGIKIIQIDGLNGGTAAAANGDTGSSGSSNLADQVVNSALRYRGQAPLIDSLLKEVGLDGGDINGLTQAIGSHELSGKTEEK